MLAPAGLGDLDLVDRIRRAGYEAFDVEMPASVESILGKVTLAMGGYEARQGFIKRFD